MSRTKPMPIEAAQLLITCPKCFARAGLWCVSYRSTRQGPVGRWCRSMHNARFDEAVDLGLLPLAPVPGPSSAGA